MTRHDTSCCALKVVVIGNVQGVVHVLSSIHGSKRYVCESVVVDNYYGINFPKYFLRSGIKEKLKSLYRIAKSFRSLKNHPRNVFHGLHVYFNSPDVSSGLFELIPQKILDDADVFLLACNDDASSRVEYKTSDYAAELIRRGISRDKIFVVPYTMTGAELPVIENESLSPLCRKLSDVRPVLRYMEYHVTDFCNLKCKGCGHLANKVNVLEFAGADTFRFSLVKLKEKFSNIEVIRIMGGEPLLCKELYEYINAAHDVFPYSQIKIVTNGLLYKNIIPETIEAIKNACAEIQVTQYPPTRKIAGEMISFCEYNGIKVSIGSPVNKFFRRVHSGINESFRKSWFACESRYCHFLHGTTFFSCPIVWWQSEAKFKDVRKSFLTDEECREYSYDLTQNITDSGWDILMKIENPMEICINCGDTREWFEWESEASVK